MNALQIAEIKRTAMFESKAELNENKNVYVLIKNGTHLGKTTTDERIVKHFVQVQNFSVWAIYNNGNSIPVWNNADLKRIMQ
ncbi:MAG: hypothetical protein J6S23_02510 [Clostridia bacterium]|nr:hypothetical protein [Clostridia bacterium]